MYFLFTSSDSLIVSDGMDFFFLQTCFGSSDRRRGRRNIFDDHVNDLLERQSAQGTVQQGSNTRESKMRSGDFVGQVNTRLRVFRDDGFLFDNGKIVSEIPSIYQNELITNSMSQAFYTVVFETNPQNC